jgi:hypothetical protein
LNPRSGSTIPAINFSVWPAGRSLVSTVAMTFPTKWISLDPKDVAVGPPLFRSVLLLFGVLPVDLHNLALLSVIPSHDNSKNEQTAPTSFKHFPRWDGIHSCTLHRLCRGTVECGPGFTFL